MEDKIPAFLLSNNPPLPKARPGTSSSFIDKGIEHISGFYETVFFHWELSRKDGLFQRLNARTKVLFLVFYIFAVSVKKDVSSEILIAVFIFPFAVMSRVGILSFYRKVFIAGFFFGVLAGLPAAFNIFLPGEPIYTILQLNWSHDFWIYHIPQTIGVTREGILAVSMLTARVANSVTITLLVVCTTPFSELIKALKAFRVPEYFLMIITLSYKYAFIFLKMLRDMHTAKKARLIGNADAAGWIAGRVACIFNKTQHRCDELSKAMTGRGFTAEVRLARLENVRAMDVVVGAGLLTLWMFLLII